MCSTLLWLALITAGQTPAATANGSAKLPSFSQVRRAMTIWLGREAQASSHREQAEAVWQLVGLYRAMGRDPRLATSPTLASYRYRIGRRLLSVKTQINQALGTADPSSSGRAVVSQSTGSPASTTTVGKTARAGSPAAGLPRPVEVRPTGEQIAPNRFPTGRIQPTGEEPSTSVGSRGGGAGPPDWGPELVALIERTVVPDFWDVHGGPGTIVYYYPGRALVVRATSEVHHRVGRTLEALRAAGR